MEGRRARKREMDRLCQQRKRKRDRENLKRLQENVQLLQQDEGHGLAARLMVDRNQHEERMLRHRKRLLQMQGLIRADLGDLNYLDKEDGSVAQADKAPTIPPEEPIQVSKYPDMMLSEGLDESILLSLSDQATSLEALISELTVPGFERSVPSRTDQHVAAPPSAFNNNTSLLPAKDARDGRQCKMWKQVEQLINRSKPQIPFPSADDGIDLDMHIVVTAVTGSWAQFSQAVRVDARWSCLRELDEKCFKPVYDQVERLAVLTIASQLFKTDMLHSSELGNGSLLPPFTKPRPSQLAFPHSAIADSYVWPGFRERLTVCHDYYTDTFLHAVHTMFRFLWPYEFRETYSVNPQTGMYHLSPQFVANIQDLRCWTMNSDFFQKYPDFLGDVPVSNPRPAMLALPDAQMLWYDFQARKDAEEYPEQNSVQAVQLAPWTTALGLARTGEEACRLDTRIYS